MSDLNRGYDLSDIGKEALQLLEDYVPVKYLDTDKAEAWAAKQVQLLMTADAEGDVEFIRDYPKALSLLAKAEGVEIARGKERLIQNRFILIARLALRILIKV